MFQNQNLIRIYFIVFKVQMKYRLNLTKKKKISLLPKLLLDDKARIMMVRVVAG